MSNYFSDFISRFGGVTIGLTSYDDQSNPTKLSPSINFVTLFNPTWTTSYDETFEGLARQIIFFITPNNLELKVNDSDTLASQDKLSLREQLNIIGLVRGSCSLLSDFGSTNRSITIEISDGAIIVVRLDDEYFVALSIVCGTDDRKQISACVHQVLQLAETTHRMFALTNSPLPHALKLHREENFKELLRSHWARFIEAFNSSAYASIGSSNILWPSKLNHRGLFGLLPGNSYFKSSMKRNSNLIKKFDNVMSHVSMKPAGYTVAIMDQTSIKYSGILHMNLGKERKLERTAIIDICNLFETVNASGKLNPTVFEKVKKLDDIYALLTSEWQIQAERAQVQDSEEDESLNEQSTNSENGLAMLYPARLTNSLVSQPFNGTVSGLKNLSSAVTDSMYEVPSWLNKLNYFATKIPQVEPMTSDLEDTVTHNNGYLVGLVDDQICGLFVHIRTTVEDNSKYIEYSMIVYKQDNVLIMLFYESGLEILGEPSFYSSLEKEVFWPLNEVIESDGSSESHPVSNSLNSLPEPIKAAVHGVTTDTEPKIDDDFYFIICDPLKQLYQTSLPELPGWRAPGLNSLELENISPRVICHLHDHLISHYLLETTGQAFDAYGSMLEQLHKFSSSKSNDWLFYSFRHKQKVIIIVRNSNYRSKTMPPPTPQGNYLMQVADRVYGAANLGFLETLGGDVRIWLGGVGTESDVI